MTTGGELVSKAQAGDLSGNEELVRRFSGSAFVRAFWVLGESHLAEDAVQDAFVEAYRSLGSLNTPEAFSGWFDRLVLTACNRMTRRKTLPTSSRFEVEDAEQDEADPSDILENQERDRTVHAAI